MLVGVLALQGDFREHLFALAECGVEAIAVKNLDEINSIDALVLPGGNPQLSLSWREPLASLIASLNGFTVVYRRTALAQG